PAARAGGVLAGAAAVAGAPAGDQRTFALKCRVHEILLALGLSSSTFTRVGERAMQKAAARLQEPRRLLRSDRPRDNQPTHHASEPPECLPPGLLCTPTAG